jgi:hypothetical protein
MELVSVSFVKIGSLRATIPFVAQMNFYPSFPQVFPSFGEIQYKRSAHNAVQHL